jgi:hypothetical protein
MADPHKLHRRALDWTDEPGELDIIMADRSTLSKKHPFHVSQAADALLLKGPRTLNAYQSAMCQVYLVRGCCGNEQDEALDGIDKAGEHLKILKEAFEPLAALGMEEHPQVSELAAMIEELKK